MNPRYFVFIALFLTVSGEIIAQQEISRNIYTTQRLTTAPPVIDGKLGDAVWGADGWFTAFRQSAPREGAAPSERTAFKVRYDERYLYVAIRAYDSQPEAINRQVARRDQFAGDMMGIAFDSYLDRRTAYEFNLTASGAKVDLLVKGNREFDTSWNAAWDGAVGLEDSAWVAEMRIPFSQLRFSDAEKQIWGLHVWRWIHRLEEETQFQVIPLDAVGMVYHFGELHGIEGLKPTRRIEVTPYVVARGETFQEEPGNPFVDGTRTTTGAGLDAKVGLSSAFTLDVTLNPDFGQVESDPSVMNLSAFETFFEEKRPFFLEGSNIFEFNFEGNDVFYSRRIGAAPRYSPPGAAGRYDHVPEATTILGAAKITGKTQNGLSVGILESLTAEEGVQLAENGRRWREPAEPFTHHLVGRVEKDFGAGNTVVGGIVTAVNRKIDAAHLDFQHRNAYSAGLNFRHYWSGRTYFVEGMAVASAVDGSREALLRTQTGSTHYFQRPDADYLELDSARTSLRGSGASLGVGRGGNSKLRYSGEFSFNSPGLNLNDAGYMQIADRMNVDVRADYVENEPTRYFRSFDVGFMMETDWDFGGDMTEQNLSVDFGAQFHNFWRLNGYLGRRQEALYVRKLRGGPAMLNPGAKFAWLEIESDTRKPISFEFGASVSRDDARSHTFDVSPEVDWRVHPKLSLSLNATYEYNLDDLQYIARVEEGTEPRYLLGRIHQKELSTVVRVSYSPLPDLSVQLYAQPFVSAGRYDRIKVVTNPTAGRYDDRFQLLTATPFWEDPDIYTFDEDGDGTADYLIDRPDFNVHELRSNLVLRWEYRPGSNFYVVWSQQRAMNENRGAFDGISEYGRLFDAYPHNVFALKISHYFRTS